MNPEYNEYRIPLMPTNLMYKKLSLLKFDDIYQLFLLQFYQFIRYKKPDIFDEFLSSLLPSHRYPSRGHRINLPYARLDIAKQSTVFQICKTINEVDQSLLSQQSKSTLKKRFKEMVLGSY